jgi:4-amino-4-deoxy-L-arabinose transferase-like glycosyltransferase
MASWATRLSARTSLRVKLVAGVLAMVALALVAVSVASVSAMRGYLLDRTDQQLTSVARVVAHVATQPGYAERVPITGQYPVELRDATGQVIWRSSRTLWRPVDSDPNVPPEIRSPSTRSPATSAGGCTSRRRAPGSPWRPRT